MIATREMFPPGGAAGNAPSTPLRWFLPGQPKALGTVQIMIGIVTLLFGIVLVSDPPFAPFSVISGVDYWASVVYIITGSLSIAAESKLHPCLVQGSLGMNVVSAIFSLAAIGLLAGDLILNYICYSYEDCYRFQTRSKAISGVLIVFAVLQFIISISLSAFACKATCCTEPTVNVVAYANQAATGNPHNVVYIPQAQVNMHNPAPQNIYQWPHSK